MQVYNPGDWDTRVTFVTAGLGENRLLPADRNRVALTFRKLANFVSALNVKQCPTNTSGWIDELNEFERTFYYRDWGGIIGLDWYSFQVTTPCPWVIIESLYNGG